MSAVEDIRSLFTDDGYGTTLTGHQTHIVLHGIAELEDELAFMTTGAQMALSAHDDLERVLEHEEESNHISIEQWGIWEERAKRAEAALAERDELQREWYRSGLRLGGFNNYNGDQMERDVDAAMERWYADLRARTEEGSKS